MDDQPVIVPVDHDPFQASAAPPQPTMPTNPDADFANANGMFYGQPWERYATNKDARVLGTDGHPVAGKFGGGNELLNPAASDVDLENMSGMRPGVSRAIGQRLHNIYTRAALAAQRDPIATLGFDPRHASMDIVTADTNPINGRFNSGKDTPVAGMMNPITGEAYVNNIIGDMAETLTHESIHRGLEGLANMRPADFMNALGDWTFKGEKPTSPFQWLDSEENENLVRYIMQTTMGPTPNPNKPLDEEAAQFYRSDPARLQRLQRLQALAAETIAAKHPMGPR